MSLTLSTASELARSGKEWDQVYRYLSKYPEDLFAVSEGRRWPIIHQVVYHGDVDLLKRLLALHSKHPVNIRLDAADGQSLLDVARERKEKHPEMRQYIEHLFLQDDLFTAAHANHWKTVMNILKHDRSLCNEKPLNSSNFLLHDLVRTSDEQTLKEFLANFSFDFTVRNDRDETPLQLAQRLNKTAMCRLLQPTNEPNEDQICLLTQKPLVDPVLASDGFTYERSAIEEWLRKYPFSPRTAAPMNPVLKERNDSNSKSH